MASDDIKTLAGIFSSLLGDDVIQGTLRYLAAIALIIVLSGVTFWGLGRSSFVSGSGSRAGIASASHK